MELPLFELDEYPPSSHMGRFREVTARLDELFALSLGVKSDLFEQLKDPKSIGELVARTGWNREITSRLIDCLQAFGLIMRKGDAYSNGEYVNCIGLLSSPFSQVRSIVRLTGHDERISRIIKSLKEGPPKERLDINQVFSPQVLLGMSEHVMRGGVHETAEAISGLAGFQESRRMLDLGEGHSLYSIALSKRNPGVSVTVFDLPAIIDGLSEPMCRKHGADRVEFIRGDFMTDDIGNGYDFVLCSDVLHRTRSENEMILRKIHTAMIDSALLAIKETHLDDLGNSRFGAFFALILSTYGTERRVFPTMDFKSMIESSGFRVISGCPISASSDSSWLTIAERV
jgi:hypothetical protein